MSTRGYRALTHEELAAVVHASPRGDRQFDVRFELPDGRTRSFFLAGDEIYVDARILKWKPIVNILGLHTAYALDRVAGRYAEIEDERVKERAVFELHAENRFDLFDLRRRYPFLSPLIDAEYGSATFHTATKAAALELRVSTSGLLFRERPPQSRDSR